MQIESGEAAGGSLHDEALIDYGTARRKHVPLRSNGKPVAPSTFQRWAGKGINGVRLEVLYCGATPMTSVEAIQRFFRAVTAARLANLQTDEPTLLVAADDELLKAGLL